MQSLPEIFVNISAHIEQILINTVCIKVFNPWDVLLLFKNQ